MVILTTVNSGRVNCQRQLFQGGLCCIMPRAAIGHHDSSGCAASRDSQSRSTTGSSDDRIRGPAFHGQPQRIRRHGHLQQQLQHIQQAQHSTQQQPPLYKHRWGSATALTSPIWSSGTMGQARWPGLALIVFLLLGTLTTFGEASMTSSGGTSSNNPNSNDETSSGNGGHNKGLVASSTLCPPKCKCLPNKQILCQEAGLDSLPTKYIPKDARQIQMMSNSISLIPTDAFKHFRHLKKLLLDNNQITVVAPNAFRGLKHMEELSLQNNPLTVLASYSFSGLQHIQFLNLGYNRIQSIEANAFADSRDIEHISLDANPLVIIKTKAFNDIRDVGVIYMPLRVDTIQADAFHGLENVTELAFDQMKSDAIGQFAFRGLNKVDRIIISNSVVRVFDSGAFTGLKDANTILLEGNIIQTIKAATFAGTRNVRSVKLVNNRITNLVPGSLDGLSPEVRQLRGNFIPCDCRLGWIQAVLKMSHAANTTFCSEPSELHNTTVAYALEVQRAQEQLSFNQVHTSCRPEDFEPKKGYSEQQKVNTATTADAIRRLTPSSSTLFALLIATGMLAL